MDEVLGEYGSLITEIIVGSVMLIFIINMFVPTFQDWAVQFINQVV